MNGQPITFVDIETTGFSPIHCKITEVAMIRYENNSISETYTTLINPQQTIVPKITEVTGITQEMVNEAPLFEEIYQDIRDMLRGSTFVAHSVNFDYGFLKSEFKSLGIPFHYPKFCTVELSRKLYPEQKRHNLDAIMERHGLENDERHRALGDAMVLYHFVSNHMQNSSIEDWNRLVKSLLT